MNSLLKMVNRKYENLNFYEEYRDKTKDRVTTQNMIRLPIVSVAYQVFIYLSTHVYATKRVEPWPCCH